MHDVKVLVVATGRKTRGGITSVIKAHETGEQWKKYHCHWVQTHRDGRNWEKIGYLITAWIDYIFRLPFYDIVHIHFSMPMSAKRKILFAYLAKLLRKKLILHLHCGSQIDDIWNRSYDYLYSVADVGLFLSVSLKERVKKYVKYSADFRVLYNPCPRCLSLSQFNNEKTILFSGTLNANKGYADLLEAFSIIAPHYPDWKLLLAGNGEIEQVKKMVYKLHIEQQVLFPGWVKGAEKARIFSAASIFCLPSYGEGFPMAVLDAWAYGLPVITTPVGGIPDVAVDGENMLLFTPGDVEGLAAQLERMMRDEALRERISEASRHFAQQEFNIDSINQQLGDIYEELSTK